MRERPISITIFGILNIGMGLLGLGGLFLSSMFQDLGTSAATPSVNSIFAFIATLNQHPSYILWNQITLPLNAAASLLLVATGIGLLLLKNWARLASIGCGIYKIIFVFLNCAVFYWPCAKFSPSPCKRPALLSSLFSSRPAWSEPSSLWFIRFCWFIL